MMMSPLLPLVIVAGMTFSAPVPATSPACDPSGSDGQLALNACAYDAQAAADHALNSTWKELLVALAGDTSATDALRVAQRVWLQFRVAEVAAHFALEAGENPRVVYGSIYPMHRANLLAALTHEREAHLHMRLDDIASR